MIRHQLLRHRPRRSHRPLLLHRKLLHHSPELDLDHLLIDAIFSIRRDPRHLSLRVRRHHQPMFDQRVLLHRRVYIAAAHVIARLHPAPPAHELPRLRRVQRRHVHSSRYEAIAAHRRDRVQRSLNPVEDVFQRPRSQIHAQRLSRALHRVTDREPARLFVALDRGRVALEPDDLTDQRVAADADEFVHRRAVHVIGDDDGAGDLAHATERALGLGIVVAHDRFVRSSIEASSDSTRVDEEARCDETRGTIDRGETRRRGANARDGEGELQRRRRRRARRMREARVEI